MVARADADLSRPVAQFATPVDTVVREDLTVAQAIDSLRQRQAEPRIFYIYTVDADDRLVGVVPIRSLILAPADQPVRSIMKSQVICVRSDATLEEALELFAMHRLLALPVVDEAGRLIGAVDVEVYTAEMYDLAEVDRVHDLVQMVGMSAELSRHQSAWSGFRLRMPWLGFNLVGGLACAGIAWFFEAALERVVIVAMFVPLVLTLGEAVSMQAMTLSLQLLHSRGMPERAMRRRVSLEWRTAGLLGLASGAFAAGVALLWNPGPGPTLVIGLSVLLAMLASATIGVIMPGLLHALSLDPKVAAGPLSLMVGDIVTITTYLGLAMWWLT